MERRTLLGGAAVAGAGALLAAALGEGEARPPAREGARFPNVRLITHRGEHVRLYDDLIHGNRIVMFNMMYTRCEATCGGILLNLARVHRVLGDRMGRSVHLYSVTLDPGYDAPEVLSLEAERVGAGPGWTFLTGTRDSIEKLRRSLGFTDPDPRVDADRNSHSGNVRIGNDALDRWIMCPGLNRPEQLAQQALSVGLASAS